MSIEIQKPSIGRVVHVALKQKEGGEVTRPALVVNAFGGHRVNVKVSLDGGNDARTLRPDTGAEIGADGKAVPDTLWLTSIGYDADGAPGTWRYPPHEAGKVTVE